jgi:hypothetical protein
MHPQERFETWEADEEAARERMEAYKVGLH